MGVKQTKIEGCYIPDNPPSSATFRENVWPFEANPSEPRSPTANICRTPLSELNSFQRQQIQQARVMATDKPLGALRKRFFKGFTYNISDPSNVQLNRSPVVFDDAQEKTLNLNDTFADLFVESRALVTVAPLEDKDQDDGIPAANSVTNNSSIEIVSLECEEETQACPAVLQQTPVLLQQIDPHSPSIGVERTPIIFSDDYEAVENAMLESILARLSLNLSNTSSVASLSITQQTNKYLERVGKKRSHSPHKTARHAKQQRSRIYLDNDKENVENATPKTLNNQELTQKLDGRKRTPLSCVKNRSHFRSRSVERSEKSLKARSPSVCSYNENLNATENVQISNDSPCIL